MSDMNTTHFDPAAARRLPLAVPHLHICKQRACCAPPEPCIRTQLPALLRRALVNNMSDMSSTQSNVAAEAARRLPVQCHFSTSSRQAMCGLCSFGALSSNSNSSFPLQGPGERHERHDLHAVRPRGRRGCPPPARAVRHAGDHHPDHPPAGVPLRRPPPGYAPLDVPLFICPLRLRGHPFTVGAPPYIVSLFYASQMHPLFSAERYLRPVLSWVLLRSQRFTIPGQLHKLCIIDPNPHVDVLTGRQICSQQAAQSYRSFVNLSYRSLAPCGGQNHIPL